jgi:hypothetical protein
MTSTTTAYLAVSQNLSRYQAMTAAEPAVKTATAYYEANIGSVKSIQDLVDNYRLLSYALDAYGLGDQINAKGLITKVLEGGVSNPKSLANTLGDSRWKAFAAAFNFAGGASPSSTRAVQATTSDYVEQQLESDQGARDAGVQLALYFQRVAPTVTSEYGILADSNLLQVAATIMGISPTAAYLRASAPGPCLAKALLGQALSLRGLRRLSEAMAAFDAAEALGSREAVAGKGCLMLTLGNFEQGLQGYEAR